MQEKHTVVRGKMRELAAVGLRLGNHLIESLTPVAVFQDTDPGPADVPDVLARLLENLLRQDGRPG
jgi:hypothetical protein